jgi:hypothetical protein
MPTIILETDRVIVRTLIAKDSSALSRLMHCDRQAATDSIHAWSEHKKQHGFTIYGVFLKKNNTLYGYCGAREIMWQNRPEVEMCWQIQREFPNDPNDDLDFETAFYVRNYLFKQFNIKSMVSFVSEKDPRGMNIAEEIDMVSDEKMLENGMKWLVYSLTRESPKFLRSAGSDDSEPLRTSIRNRKELTMNPAAKGRKPRLTPY